MDKFSFDINIYSLLGHSKIDLIFKIWEIVLLNKSLMVLADTPNLCSEMIYGLISIIFPIAYNGNFRPYFTIFDKNFDFLKSSGLEKNFLIGVTNPLFLNVN